MADVVGKVEELAALLNEHGLAAIKVQEGDLTIELRRDAAMGASTAQNAQSPSGAAALDEGRIVQSPMVGVFYRRPTPNDSPLVEEGERISVGQVIGLIEAMKVFSEVESPAAGIIKKFFVEDGALVQEGDALLVLEP